MRNSLKKLVIKTTSFVDRRNKITNVQFYEDITAIPSHLFATFIYRDKSSLSTRRS